MYIQIHNIFIFQYSATMYLLLYLNSNHLLLYQYTRISYIMIIWFYPKYPFEHCAAPKAIPIYVCTHKYTYISELSFCCTTYQAILLLWAGTAAGTEKVATLARLGPETAAAVALGGAVDLRELLAVVRALAPTAVLRRKFTYIVLNYT